MCALAGTVLVGAVLVAIGVVVDGALHTFGVGITFGNCKMRSCLERVVRCLYCDTMIAMPSSIRLPAITTPGAGDGQPLQYSGAIFILLSLV